MKQILFGLLQKVCSEIVIHEGLKPVAMFTLEVWVSPF